MKNGHPHSCHCSAFRSAAELPLVYRDAEAPAGVNVVEPLLEEGRRRSVPIASR
jgi:hypothetical protein